VYFVIAIIERDGHKLDVFVDPTRRGAEVQLTIYDMARPLSAFYRTSGQCSAERRRAVYVEADKWLEMIPFSPRQCRLDLAMRTCADLWRTCVRSLIHDIPVTSSTPGVARSNPVCKVAGQPGATVRPH